MSDYPYFDPKAGRKAWNAMPVRTRARLAAWREVEGDLSNFGPEGWQYMIENWPEVDELDCPDCGHPWSEHDLADNRDDEGRALTGTAPLIEVCTAGSGKELGPDDHPLEAACGCIRTYWPDPPYEPASPTSREQEGARVERSKQ